MTPYAPAEDTSAGDVLRRESQHVHRRDVHRDADATRKHRADAQQRDVHRDADATCMRGRRDVDVHADARAIAEEHRPSRAERAGASLASAPPQRRPLDLI
jgi:hypothetical protein